MGYTISIGQAIPEFRVPKDNDGKYETVWLVEPMRFDEAPVDGSPTDYTNSRWPSYTAWTDFTRQAGLHQLFFCPDEGLMREHPGCFQLTDLHLRVIMEAECSDPEQQGRLNWLKFWAKWAVEKCSQPAIANS